MWAAPSGHPHTVLQYDVSSLSYTPSRLELLHHLMVCAHYKRILNMQLHHNVCRPTKDGTQLRVAVVAG